MAWSYVQPEIDTGWSETTLQVWCYNNWSLTEVAPDTAGMIRLQLDSYIRLFNSYPYPVETYYTDTISFGGTTITMRPRHRLVTGDSYSGYVEVPGSWSGKEVTINVCRKTVRVVLGATAATPSTLTVGDGFFGTNIPMSINPVVTGLTHTLTVACAGQTETLLTKSSTTSLNWNPAVATYAPLLPNANEATATFTCSTYYGDELIGTTTATITVRFAQGSLAPELTTGWATAAPYNTGAVSGFTSWIQGYSKGEVTFDSTKVSCKYGASISSFKIECNGLTVTASPYRTNTLFGVSASIVCTVTDSRGQTANETLSITLLAYNAPSISDVEVFRCDSSGVADEAGTFISVKATATISSLNSENTFTLKAYHRVTGGNFDAGQNLTSGTALLIGTVSADASYEVKIGLTDRLGNTATALRSVTTQRWAMKFRPNGQGVAFGKAPESDNVLELPAGWSIKIGGVNLLDLICPVGNLYITTSSVHPMTLYGGTWELLEDVTLYAVGQSQQAQQMQPVAQIVGSNNQTVDFSNGRAHVGFSDNDPTYTAIDAANGTDSTFEATHIGKMDASWGLVSDVDPNVTTGRKAKLSGMQTIDVRGRRFTVYMWRRLS